MSAPMVRAILDGRKTQTRRVVTPQPAALCRYEMNGAGTHALHLGPPRDPGETMSFVPPTPTSRDHRLPSAYGTTGDRLWVRETWWRGRWTEEHHYNDIDGISRCSTHWRYHKPGDAETIAYVADGDPPGGRTPSIGDHELCEGWDKMPSIFLCRADSRITLEVTEVRVQRLQEINEDDARAEGMSPSIMHPGIWHNPLPEDDRSEDYVASARDAFGLLWQHINGKRAPWSSNPWVWAITFRRVDR